MTICVGSRWAGIDLEKCFHLVGGRVCPLACSALHGDAVSSGLWCCTQALVGTNGHARLLPVGKMRMPVTGGGQEVQASLN